MSVTLSLAAARAEVPKIPEKKEAPKIREVPKVKEAPKVKEPPKAPKAPTVKEPPKVPKVPVVKEPPKVPRVPTIKEPPKLPKIPVVKAPPKVPKVAEVKQPPRIPVVKEPPKVPKTTEVRQPPKVAEVKAPPKIAERKQPAAKPVSTPKAAVPVVRTSTEVKSPPQTESPRAVEVRKVPVVAAEESRRRNAAPRPQATPGPQNDQPEEPIDEAYRRVVEHEDDPAYYRQGGKEDYERISRFEAENFGSERELDIALQGGKVSTEVAEGRVRNVLIIEEAVQSGGVDPDDPEVVQAKKDVLEGRGGDLPDVIRRAKIIGNKAVDELEGEAPIVSVADLTAKAEDAKVRGDRKAMHEYYDQAIDALKNGGRRNSPEFRAKIIAEVGLGLRPGEDIKRVAVVVNEPPAGRDRPAAAQPPGSDPRSSSPGSFGPDGGPSGPGGPNDGTGRGPGRSSSAKNDGESNDGGGQDSSSGGGQTASNDGGGEGQSEGEKGTSSNISHQVVTDLDGNVIAEFDIDLDTGEVVKRTEGTPNPLESGERDPTRLSRQTGGRLGTQEERNAVKAVDLAAGGGGVAGPGDPKGNSISGVLLTPEERANAGRALNTATGGGLINPTRDESTVVVTDRDLKELHLRGNGGARGPSDSTAPAPPPEEGPLVGPGPVVGPAPRGEISIQRSTVAPIQVAPDVSGAAVQEVQQTGR